MSAHPPLRSFGRIKSRVIKPRQAALMETLLPSLRVPAEAFDPRTLKADAAEVWLEIGFGGGEHLAAQAARAPDVLLIGAEPFQNGVASALRHVAGQGLGNVRLHDGDARDLLARLPGACLDRVFILFPDPWPKARHHKRRLLQPATMALIADRLRPGGVLHAATDHMGYAEHIAEVGDAEPRLRRVGIEDALPISVDRPVTKYERKALAGPVVTELLWEKAQ
jgi:tRNA (guanine-N7-)-methyltransferase